MPPIFKSNPYISSNFKTGLFYRGRVNGCKIPNKETIAAINEDLKDAKRYKSVEEMLSDIE